MDLQGFVAGQEQHQEVQSRWKAHHAHDFLLIRDAIKFLLLWWATRRLICVGKSAEGIDGFVAMMGGIFCV